LEEADGDPAKASNEARAEADPYPVAQQAIKLLPMSTLELADLLNQEVVENPLLEEVPTEDLTAQEQTPAEKEGGEDKTKEKADPWDDADYEYFFGDYLDDGYRPRAPQEVKELPPIENTLSTSSSLTDHLEWQLSLQTTEDAIREIGEAIVGNLDDDGYLVASVDEIASMGPWPVEKGRGSASPDSGVRSDRRRRARSPGMPDAADQAPASRRHADGEDRHRASAAVAQPPDAGAGQEARAHHRRAEDPRRDHPAPRSETRQPLQPAAVAVRDSRTSTSSRSRINTSRC
jgi:hypothetical protein